MNSKVVAPYGSWASPVSATSFATRSVVLNQLSTDGTNVYWVEGKPLQGGRNVLLRRDAIGRIGEILPLLEGEHLFNVGTDVHGYGGKAYAVDNGVLVLSNANDQRVYLYDTNASFHQLKPLTQLDKCRYGDFEIDEQRGVVYAVREDHSNVASLENTLVAIPLDGSGARDASRILTVYGGPDFVSSPSLSPDGSKLAWITWSLPEMPWTKSELHVADLEESGVVGDPVVLVDRPGVCVYEPRWTPSGDLIHVDDSSGWANLYRTEGFTVGGDEPADAWRSRLRTRVLHPGQRAFSRPAWQLGNHNFDVLDDDHLICSWSEDAYWHLGTVRLDNGLLEEWDIGWNPVGNVTATDGRVIALANSRESAPSIIAVVRDEVRLLRESTEATISPKYNSMAQPLTWEARDGLTIHGFFYEPQNPEYEGPADELPPLLVRVHAGPTAAARAGFSLFRQYWTTRGFAFLDVNYRGSTGYGRKYRNALDGEFGIKDVEDTVDGVKSLIDRGLVDPARVAISGEASGGYTAMMALATTDVFSAGSSINGYTDLRLLARPSHKFESAYVERLLGTADPNDPVYTERSPIFLADSINAPLLLIQGSQDRIVLPGQTQNMYEKLVDAGKPVSLLSMPDQGHSIVTAEALRLAWRTELSFFATVWGIELTDPEEIVIENFEQGPA